MRIRLLGVLLLILCGVIVLSSKEKTAAWDTPFEKWTQQQALKMFNDSPWAQQQSYRIVMEGTRPGVEGDNEINNSFIVRLFSARPVREAYVRMIQLMNKYDALPQDKRQEFDARVNGILTADTSQEVVVVVAYSANVQTTKLDLKRFFDTATTETLNQSVFLYGPRGRVDLLKYVPPGNEGMGARFIFPRVVNGKPVLQPGDKELRFEFWVGPIGQRLLVGFEVRKMVYKGELAF